MPVAEVALATAICCKLHGFDFRAASRQLDPTPRSHFDEARLWVDSNAKTVELVKRDPVAIHARSYSLNQARGFFSRLFGLGRSKSLSAPADDDFEALRDLANSERTVDPARQKKLAELRKLVDESFDSA
jgi:hypothetical protein